MPFQEDVPEATMRWTKVLRTGSVEAKFMAVDVNTIMFTLEKGQDTVEVCFHLVIVLPSMVYILVKGLPKFQSN